MEWGGLSFHPPAGASDIVLNFLMIGRVIHLLTHFTMRRHTFLHSRTDLLYPVKAVAKKAELFKCQVDEPRRVIEEGHTYFGMEDLLTYAFDPTINPM